MSVRTLYVARHGEADAFGILTQRGREQCRQLGARLAAVPIDVIWHSPLPRAVDSARVIAEAFPRALVDEAPALTDHVPFVPPAHDLPADWVGFFDGYTDDDAEAGDRSARALSRRFGVSSPPVRRSTHELLVTHAYPVAWLVRDALDAPPLAWMSLTKIANTGLTVLELVDGTTASVVCVNDQSHLRMPSGDRPRGIS